MSLLVFPSKKYPQFYLSNKSHIINYFIHNFFFSGNSRIQLLINLSKLVLPDSLINLLFTSILYSKTRTPDDLSEIFKHIWDFIRQDEGLLLPNARKYDDILYIVRKSSWKRSNDKFVILLFYKHDTKPFSAAKIGAFEHRTSIELEFNNTKMVYEKFKDNPHFQVPAPIAFRVTGSQAIYYEKTLNGKPLNNFLKLNLGKKKKQHLFSEFLNKSRALFMALNFNNQDMPLQEIHRYFLDPLDKAYNTDLGGKYSSCFTRLRKFIGRLEKDKIKSVWMHGDLWGGSVLYDGYNIGIIDWEFFSVNGVPLWDFFSLAFHIGAGINTEDSPLSDFKYYFTCPDAAAIVDKHLVILSKNNCIDTKDIPLLFESYLLFNMHTRDTAAEQYWRNCLETYWEISQRDQNRKQRLL